MIIHIINILLISILFDSFVWNKYDMYCIIPFINKSYNWSLNSFNKNILFIKPLYTTFSDYILSSKQIIFCLNWSYLLFFSTHYINKILDTITFNFSHLWQTMSYKHRYSCSTYLLIFQLLDLRAKRNVTKGRYNSPFRTQGKIFPVQYNNRATISS